jgi:hypothetical protein
MLQPLIFQLYKKWNSIAKKMGGGGVLDLEDKGRGCPVVTMVLPELGEGGRVPGHGHLLLLATLMVPAIVGLSGAPAQPEPCPCS